MPWYKNSFGRDYLRIYSHRDENQAATEVAFIVDALNITPNQLILDISCGAGRHVIPLSRLGHSVIGNDLSFVLLMGGKRRIETGNFVCSDKRCTPFRDKSFDVVLSLFTSFGYFETDAENIEAINEIARVIRPGGKYLLDYINPTTAVKKLVPFSARDIDGLIIEEYRKFDAENERIIKEIVVKEGKDERRYTESVRVYQLDELQYMIQGAEFRFLNTYGDFHGSEYTNSSNRCIIESMKL